MIPSDVHDTFERLAGHAANPSEVDTSRLLTGVHRRDRRRRTTVQLTAAGVAIALLVVVGVVALKQPSNRSTHVATGPPFGTPPSGAAAPPAKDWARGKWTDLPKPPINFGEASRAFWVNGRLVVVQPEHGEGNSTPASWIGATFDPETSTWTELPSTPSELGAGANVAAAGDRLLVWGGSTAHTKGTDIDDGSVRVAFALDPSASTWHRIATPPSAATSAAVTTWTGTRLAMVNIASAHLLVSYDPTSDTWAVSDDGPPDLRKLGRQAWASSIVWTGKDVLVWFDYTPPADGMGLQRLERYDPTKDKWSRVAGDDGRPAVADVAMVDGMVIGREVATPCGMCAMANAGRVVSIDPETGAWSAVAEAPTAFLPSNKSKKNERLDPGSRQLVIGGVPVRLAVMFDPNQTEPALPEPGRLPMAVEAYDGTAHQWIDAVRLAPQLYPIVKNDEGPFHGSPQLLWTGKSLVVWGQFECIDTGRCIHPTFTRGLLYTPEA